MRSLLAVAVVLCCACGVGSKRPASNKSALECTGGDVPIYSNRYAPAAGASGVASAADAEAGYVSSDSKGSGPTTTVENKVKEGEEHTAMVVECGQAQCASGEVAISLPPAPSGGGTGGVDDFTGDDAPPTPAPNPAPAPMGTTKCVAPPPSCPQGQSAQYTLHDTWECTDCAMVVTYGGIYGNYRRCVSAPTIMCPGGQVPTFSFELETWECKPTCDNGMYDQHTIAGQLVCVPC